MYTRNPHDLWMFELVLEGENSQNRHQTDSISIYTYLYRDISIFVIYSDLMYIYIYISDMCVHITHAHTVYPLCFLFICSTLGLFSSISSAQGSKNCDSQSHDLCPFDLQPDTSPPRRSAPKKEGMNLRQKVSLR